MRISRILTIAKKESVLKLRFKWGYIFDSIVNPLRLGLLFFFVYSGFFYSGAENIGGVTAKNYIVFVLLGMTMANLFTSGFKVISNSFLREKWWKTIQGLLTSPAKKIEILLGFGIGALADILPVFLFSIIIAYIILPISLINFLYFLAIIIITYLMVLGLGFINAVFTLSNENLASFFHFASWGVIFLSCFYYPITSLPKFIHPLVKLNPLYYANVVIKSLWMYNALSIKSIFYLSILSLISLGIGILVFNKVWKKLGIHG